MGAIEDAIDDLNSQAKPNITATAKKYGCNRSTLSKRYRGVTGSKETADDQQRLLNQHQLKVLIKYIKKLTEYGSPPTTAIVKRFAQEINRFKPGPRWISRWLQLQADKLKTAYLTPIDGIHKKAKSTFYFSLYFNLLERKLGQYHDCQ